MSYPSQLAHPWDYFTNAKLEIAESASSPFGALINGCMSCGRSRHLILAQCKFWPAGRGRHACLHGASSLLCKSRDKMNLESFPFFARPQVAVFKTSL